MNGAVQAGQRAAAEVITATDDCCQACQEMIWVVMCVWGGEVEGPVPMAAEFWRAYIPKRSVFLLFYQE